LDDPSFQEPARILAISLLRKESISATVNRDGTFISVIETCLNLPEEPRRIRKPERHHARSLGYFEPMTMILDHLACSPELSARGVAALGGSSEAFSDDLS